MSQDVKLISIGVLLLCWKCFKTNVEATGAGLLMGAGQQAVTRPLRSSLVGSLMPAAVEQVLAAR